VHHQGVTMRKDAFKAGESTLDENAVSRCPVMIEALPRASSE